MLYVTRLEQVAEEFFPDQYEHEKDRDREELSPWWDSHWNRQRKEKSKPKKMPRARQEALRLWKKALELDVEQLKKNAWRRHYRERDRKLYSDPARPDTQSPRFLLPPPPDVKGYKELGPFMMVSAVGREAHGFRKAPDGRVIYYTFKNNRWKYGIDIWPYAEHPSVNV